MRESGGGMAGKGEVPPLDRFLRAGREEGEMERRGTPDCSLGSLRAESRALSSNSLTYQFCPVQATPGCPAPFWKWYFQRNTDKLMHKQKRGQDGRENSKATLVGKESGQEG